MGWHRAQLGSENGFRNGRETGEAEGATQIYLRKLYHIAIEDQEEFQGAAWSEFSTRKVSYAPTREQSGHPLSLAAGKDGNLCRGATRPWSGDHRRLCR